MITERTWKPIDVRQGQRYTTPYGLDEPIDNSFGWYKRVIQNSGRRDEKLRRYDIMDNESVEISRALDIVAEDVSSHNVDRKDDVFIIDYEDSSNVKKTTMKVVEFMKDQWKVRTEMKDEFYNHVRDVLKYGSKFFLKRPDGTLREINNKRIVGYILDHRDESRVSHYLYDQGKPYQNEEGDTIEGNKRHQGQHQYGTGYTAIPIEDLLVLKIGKGPFGESILSKAYSTWKRLQLLEDSVVIYRVVRAPEKRAFYIDTGDLPPSKSRAYVEQVRLQMKQRQISKGKDITSDFDPHSIGEDYFIPQNSEGRGSRVEQLQGGSQTGELDDVKLFGRKLAAAMRVPTSMLDTYSDSRDRPIFQERIGSVYEEEIRYMGFVARLKTQIAKCLFGHFKWYCDDRDVKLPDEIIFKIQESHNFTKYRETEVNQSLLNVYSSIQNIGHISKRFALEKYMMWDSEEITWNEDMRLRELGLTEEQIKKMDDRVRFNIVYGDGRLGEELGIQVGDQGSGYGGRF